MEHRRPSAEPQKKSGREKAKKEVQGDGDEEGEEVAPGGRVGEDKRRRPCSSAASKRGSGGGGGGGSRGGASPPRCQAEKCTADLAEAKRYYRRHKVCEAHSKAAVVIVAGLRQRFCQQCSRFHELSEFDDSKRSCRRRLAGHNERRRKNTTSETQGDRLKPLQASRPRWEDSDE